MTNTLHNKTILVTGATGLIGSGLVNALMAMPGVNVIAASRSGQKIKTAFSNHLGKANFSCLPADVNSPMPGEMPRVDAVFHAAALISRESIAKTPADVIATSLFALKNLMDMLVKQKEQGSSARLVVFSSATVYGNKTNGDIVVGENDTSIADALEHNNAPYSESKRMSEVLARAYAKQFGLDVVIARPSWVYGDSPFPNLGTAVFEFIKNALESKDIVLNGTGFPRRDNIHVDDVVSGLLRLLEQGKAGEAYNISTAGDLGSFAAIDEIAGVIAGIAREKLRHDTKVVYKAGMGTTRNPGIICDNARLKALGWTPTVSLSDGLSRMIQSQNSIK